MIGDDFAFFGFDEASWDRLVSMLLGEHEGAHAAPRGVLVVVIARGAGPVAAFHTARGSVDPSALPPLDDLEACCREMDAGACLIVRPGRKTQFGDYLAEPLDPSEDFVSRVMRFVRVLEDLGGGRLLGVWPNPLPDALLPAAPAAKPAGELLLPDDHCAVLGVFDEGRLFTAIALRRHHGVFDTLAGPSAITQWTGPLGGDWRRDHRVLVRAVERELGPVHVGLFMDLPTSESLFRERTAGGWALAYATRSLLIHPMPTYAAAALGLNGVAGLAQAAFQAIEDMDPDEVDRIATGFWHGLTDGQGLAGLLGLPPAAVVVEALRRRSAPPEDGTAQVEPDPAVADSTANSDADRDR